MQLLLAQEDVWLPELGLGKELKLLQGRRKAAAAAKAKAAKEAAAEARLRSISDAGDLAARREATAMEAAKARAPATLQPLAAAAMLRPLAAPARACA